MSGQSYKKKRKWKASKVGNFLFSRHFGIIDSAKAAIVINARSVTEIH